MRAAAVAACVCAHVQCMRVRASEHACGLREIMRASERTSVRGIVRGMCLPACLLRALVRVCACVGGVGWRAVRFGGAGQRGIDTRQVRRSRRAGECASAQDVDRRTRGRDVLAMGGRAVRGAALGRAEGRDAGAGGEGGPNARGRARGGWWSARGGHAGAGSGRCGRVGWRSHRGGRNEVERRSFSGEFFISINSFSSIAIGFDYRISISSPPMRANRQQSAFIRF